MRALEKMRLRISLREKHVLVAIWICLGIVLMGLVVPYSDPQAVVPVRLLVAAGLWLAGVPVIVYQYYHRR